MSDIDMTLLGPEMCAELWNEAGKQLGEAGMIGTPYGYVSAIEEGAYRAAVAAVVTWARVRVLRATMQKDTQ